uniref:Reverse transcriptase domain-containing protein n=1 Tax=Heligmosomoides polygyrus TaxID=6339 RepID=A0A183G742_HELPZ
LKEKEAAVISRIRLPTVTTVDETWKDATDAITRAARLELGTTKPRRRCVDKQAWLWTDDVREKVREKKRFYHVSIGDKTVHSWWNYREAKKAAKKTVAAVKVAYYADVSEKLETRVGEGYLYRLAKARCRQAEDTEKFFGINDDNGRLLMDRKRAVKRWHDYFEEISNVEFEHLAVPFASPVYSPVLKIRVSESEAALKKMKSGKATGPDDLPDDLWNSNLPC